MPRKKTTTPTIEVLYDNPDSYSSYKMIVMGDLIQVRDGTFYAGGSVDNLIKTLQALRDIYIDAFIVQEPIPYESGYQDIIYGWRKMTEAEEKKANRLRESNKKKQLQDKEALRKREYEQFLKLKDKFDNE